MHYWNTKNPNFNTTPEFLMSDMSLAIRKAAHNVWEENFTHLICAWHVKKAIKENIKNLKAD